MEFCVVCVKSECFVCVLYVHTSKEKGTASEDTVRFICRSIVPEKAESSVFVALVFGASLTDPVRIIPVVEIGAVTVKDTFVCAVAVQGFRRGKEEHLAVIGQTDLHIVI